MQSLSPVPSSKTRKRWDRTDTLVFTFGAIGLFIAFTISSSVLMAAVATGVVLLVNAGLWLLV